MQTINVEIIQSQDIPELIKENSLRSDYFGYVWSVGSAHPIFPGFLSVFNLSDTAGEIHYQQHFTSRLAVAFLVPLPSVGDNIFQLGKFRIPAEDFADAIATTD